MFYRIRKSKLYHNVYYFVIDAVGVLLGSAAVFGIAFIAGL